MNEFKGARLLIVDDDQELLDVMIGFFRPRGSVVVTFATAEEALDAIIHHGLRPDAIIVDLKLPGMSGIEFTRKLIEDGRDVPPVFVMTASSSIDLAVEAIDAGASDFVVKPIHFSQLQISVGRALRVGRLEQENVRLRTLAKKKEGEADNLAGRSQSWKKVVDLAKRVSSGVANILITGESGTGKEVVARMINQNGPRKKLPFVAINCSAIPENLLESEFFGHSKGAFTGAADKKKGLFEEADGGTLFLDEIGDLNLPLQAKLLRAVQERAVKRLGENQMRKIDVHIIAATHKNLRQEVAEGRFREDLFFRLNVIPIQIPPLRERKEDIIPLAEFFLQKYTTLNGSKANGFTKLALERLLGNPWYGNVRELENTIERAVVLASGDLIDVDDLMFESQSAAGGQQLTRGPLGPVLEGNPDGRILPLHEVEKRYIKYALNKLGGTKESAAKVLGINRKTLYRRIQELDGAEL